MIESKARKRAQREALKRQIEQELARLTKQFDREAIYAVALGVVVAALVWWWLT